MENIRRNIDQKTRRYLWISVAIAIVIHAMIFVNAIIFLVAGVLTVYQFIAIHLSAQGIAFLNLAFGPGTYRKYLEKKAHKLDEVLVNRYT